jgi:cytochrome c-type biogenesis protein CcmH/NrfF
MGHLMRAGFIAAVCAVAIFFSTAMPAATQDAEDTGWAYALSRDVMSPFCPGRTLAACPSPQAAELVQWIALQEQAGASREEVEDQLYARYGDVMRSAPKAEGWGLAAYVIPFLLALVGIGLVALVLRRLTRGAPAPAPAPAAAMTADRPVVVPAEGTDDSEIERLVDEELSRI